MSDAVVRLSFPARAEYLILARLALAGVARAVPIDEETLADLKLAVTEACGNVVRHAYPDEGSGVVQVSIEVRGGDVVVAVSDDGVGVDSTPRERAEADDGGMGLAIIGAIADELTVAEGPQGGTRLTLRKRIAG